MDSGGNVSELYSCLITAWLEWFPGKQSWCRNDQVCQRIERTNGLDTALYKNLPMGQAKGRLTLGAKFETL